MSSVGCRTGRIGIGHTIYSFKDGGMERGLLNIINHSNPRRFLHVILCLTESGAFTQHLRVPDCVVINLRKKDGNDFRLPKRLAEAALHHGLDILHARGWPTLVETAVAARLANISRTVYGFHGRTIGDLRGIGFARRWAQRIFIRGYQRVITLNRLMADDFARECGLSPRRIRIIANGVDVDHFRPHADREGLRHRYSLPPNRLIIGNVARLDPVKNHELIIQALVRLKHHASRPFLLLVGEGEHRPVLEALVKKHGLTEDVRLFGYSDQISSLLNCLDIYIQSSLYEGFSNTILEAMACGIPVVATRVGGTADLFTDEQEGFLVPCGDVTALTEVIQRLADSAAVRQRIAVRARQCVEDRFSVQSMVHDYEALYEELAVNIGARGK